MIFHSKGDCCPKRDDPELGNGVCNGLQQYNNEICNFDGKYIDKTLTSDCIVWNQEKKSRGLEDCFVENPSLVGDRHCDGGLYWINDACYNDDGTFT